MQHSFISSWPLHTVCLEWSRQKYVMYGMHYILLTAILCRLCCMQHTTDCRTLYAMLLVTNVWLLHSVHYRPWLLHLLHWSPMLHTKNPAYCALECVTYSWPLLSVPYIMLTLALCALLILAPCALHIIYSRPLHFLLMYSCPQPWSLHYMLHITNSYVVYTMLYITNSLSLQLIYYSCLTTARNLVFCNYMLLTKVVILSTVAAAK